MRKIVVNRKNAPPGEIGVSSKTGIYKAVRKARKAKEKVRIQLEKKKAVVFDGKIVKHENMSKEMQRLVKKIRGSRVARSVDIAIGVVATGIGATLLRGWVTIWLFPMTASIMATSESFALRRHHRGLEKEVLIGKPVPEIEELKGKYKYFFVKGKDMVFTNRKGLIKVFNTYLGRKRGATSNISREY